MFSVSIYALNNIKLDDFENGQINFTETVNLLGTMEHSVVDNPLKDGINSSNKVWKWERKAVDPDWAGCWAVLKNEIPSGYHKIKVKYYRTDANSTLRIKCEGSNTKEFLPVNAPTKINEWETLVYDLKANNISNISILGLQPDFSVDRKEGTIVYIDDIEVIYDASITTLTFFDDSSDDRFHDQSYIQRTSPSSLLGTEWNDASSVNGSKLTCTTAVARSGNSLIFQWTSNDGGTWDAMAASQGWAKFDVTTMTHLCFYAYSVEGLTQDAMPMVFFEAEKEGNHRSTPLHLSSYSDDLQAGEWTKIEIPLSEFWKDGFGDYKDVLKGFVLGQNAADGTEHTLYIDDIYFENRTAQSVEEVTAFSSLSAHYNEGVLQVSGGEINSLVIVDLSGRVVMQQGNVIGNQLNIILEKGVYVIVTPKGVSKFLVK